MLDTDTKKRLVKSGILDEKKDLGTEIRKKLEEIEVTKGIVQATDFPKPVQTMRLYYESFKSSIEEPYYWLMHFLKQVRSYPDFIKLTDITAASESSVFFGVTQQRLGMQQDKVSQFLATTGKMTKELFQLVRELRILDERLEYYDRMDKKEKSAEVTLKGIWIDLVEGGSKNPSSVYGMAHEVGFSTLPDLFFDVSVYNPNDIDRVVNALDFNRKVREVLGRKLMTFLVWKEKTYKELKTRRIFTIRYLRQHFNSIKMYMVWVKPYLRNIRRLQLNDRMMDSPELVSAFETSVIELEFIAVKKKSEKDSFYPCILVTFHYRTMPSLTYQGEGYNRAPIHVGRVEMTMRAYSWRDEDVQNWKKYRYSEDLDLLSSIDDSLKAAMEALGDDLEKYLKESGEEVPVKKEADKKKERFPSALEPFVSIISGFGEIFSAFAGSQEKKQSSKDKFELEKQDKDAQDSVKADVWNLYDKYKKAHGWLSW